MMILQDLQKRIEVIGKERNEVEREIDQAFETLVASSSSTVQHKVKQLWSEL
jgi:predicted methyltransferase